VCKYGALCDGTLECASMVPCVMGLNLLMVFHPGDTKKGIIIVVHGRQT